MIVNKVRIEGNSIYIRSNPQTGILALTSFVDNSAGETGGKSFTKTFRYSINGIIFTDWLSLNTANILAIPVTSNDVLVIELQYQRNPVGDQSLSVSSATIGTTNATLTDQEAFKSSIFNQFFGSGDVEVLNWMINVLDKLFQKGLLPNYIDRYNDIGSPDDFIEFWGAICRYFAYYVIYARKYQIFYGNDYLLREYIEERGLKTAKDNNLSQLQTLMQKYYREISRRGTGHIVEKTGVGIPFDGELLRLINYQTSDEFLFNLNRPEHFGWNIDNGSPLYRSLTAHDNINKWYEKQSEPSDITKYSVSGTVAVAADNGKNVLHLTNGGIGYSGTANPFLIPVDEFMDYEFSFYCKKTDGDNLTVGVDCFDKDLNLIDLTVLRKDGATPENNFFVNDNFNRTDKYLYCRFFLYNKLKPINANDNLNLKMIAGIKYVIPKIFCSGQAWVYNVRFLPMALPYAKGFVQVNNFIDCFLRNNNHQLGTGEVYNFIRKYLIPYNAHIKLIDPQEAGDYSLEEDATTLTAPTVPTVTTAVPTGLSGSTATLGGTVTADGGSPVNERGIVWGTSANPTIANNRQAMGIGTGAFSRAISGLPTVDIYIRAYAINSVGISYGNQQTIAASSIPVAVVSINRLDTATTNANTVNYQVVLNTAVGALLNTNFSVPVTGTISGAGITSITQVNPTTFNVVVNTGTGSGNLGLNLTNDTGLPYTISNKPFTGQTYLIDKEKPVVVLTSTPDASTSNHDATFAFNATDTGGSGLNQILVSLDGGAFVPVTSPIDYTALGDGSHTFQVKATDNAGNVSDVVSYTWVISTAVLSEPFDYLVVRYNWATGAGTDLDIVAGFVDNGISIDAVKNSVKGASNKWVGFANNTAIPNGGAIDNSYAFWALDNTSGSGVEAVLINFKKVIDDFGGSITAEEILFNLNCVWWAALGTGVVTLSLETYLGGTMSKVGTDIINSGGTLVQSMSLPDQVVTVHNNLSTWADSQNVGLVKYNKTTKAAILQAP